MRERARLLREGTMDHHWLTALEGRMGEEGYAIAKARLHCLEKLHNAMRESPGVFPQASLRMVGAVEEWAKSESYQAIEDEYTKTLQANRFKDAASGITTFGPHRSDMDVFFGQTTRRASECSTGEQKSLLISIILASARAQAELRERRPLLLLDEVVAHLDSGRREALFEEIEALQMQAWMTGTDYDIFKSLKKRAQFFHIENSQLISNTVELRAANK
jgi:DNA replication and repair protein RecF